METNGKALAALQGLVGGYCGAVLGGLAFGRSPDGIVVSLGLCVLIGTSFGSMTIRGVRGAILHGAGFGAIFGLVGLVSIFDASFRNISGTKESRLISIPLGLLIGASLGGILGLVQHRFVSKVGQEDSSSGAARLGFPGSPGSRTGAAKPKEAWSAEGD